MSADCRFQCDTAAYVGGELSAGEEAQFEAHLAGCADCREAVASIRNVIGRLHAVPRIEPKCDLTPLVQARLRKEPLSTPPRWRWAMAAAAGLTLMAGGTMVMSPRKPSPPVAKANVVDENAASVARALTWFSDHQEPNGSWNPEKWGGNKRFEVALTALSALALSSESSPTPKSSTALTAALRWLRAQQAEDGSFGPNYQVACYNQSIATLALLQCYQRHPDPELKRSIDGALGVILARQIVDGGWGYLHSPYSDRSITEWHVEALELASALGWENTRSKLAHAREWLASHPTPMSDVEEPADSPSVVLAENSSVSPSAKLDFSRAYFLTTELKRRHDASSLKRLAAIRRALLREQESGGSDSGSWPAEDRWGRAGGRLYSTALASLSMRDS